MRKSIIQIQNAMFDLTNSKLPYLMPYRGLEILTLNEGLTIHTDFKVD